tara:strand:- start:23 stop:475 length:453 start_codon:yes stop_codon:yes gene_type:complete
MYTLKLRTVLGDLEGTSHEFPPVQVIPVNEQWTDFIKFNHTTPPSGSIHPVFDTIDYGELEELIRGTLEHFVINAISSAANVKVAELEINTGDYIIYVTITKNVGTLVESEAIFTAESMKSPEDTHIVFNTGWDNRLLLTTQIGVCKRIK